MDGRSHGTPDGTRLLDDVYRDVKLRRAGWTVIRVPAWDVRLNPRAVAHRILGGLRADLLPTAPSEAASELYVPDEFEEGATSGEVA